MPFSVSRLTMFAVISAIEQDLRRFIIDNLAAQAPPRELLGDEGYKKLKERHASEHTEGSEGLGLEELLPFADFADAYALLNSQRARLSAALAGYIQRQTPNLERLAPIRNRVMHTRPFTEEDFSATLDIGRELSRSADPQWQDLRLTLRRLQEEPSFVLSLAIPRRNWETAKWNHNLPLPDFDDTGFIGRTKQVDTLFSLCTSQWPVISIVGEGGLGKTALALKVAYDLLDDPACPFEAIVWSSSKTKQLTVQQIVGIEGLNSPRK